MRLKIEDLVPKELLVSESFMEFKKLITKRQLKDLLLWLKNMLSEEHSIAKKPPMLKDTKLLKSKDSSLKPDWEEKELTNKIKLKDGKNPLLNQHNIKKFMMFGLPKIELKRKKQKHLKLMLQQRLKKPLKLRNKSQRK